jgi:hypothetical protein
MYLLAMAAPPAITPAARATLAAVLRVSVVSPLLFLVHLYALGM